MDKDHTKYPRLYVDSNLEDTVISNQNQSHYLTNVMRKKTGDSVRIFNGRDGEFLAIIDRINKKSVTLRIEKRLRPQTPQIKRTHLLFSPLKKKRMDFVIEKCTELGVTDFHPVITQHTEVRSLKQERIELQIIEACEQSERVNIPQLHTPVSLSQKITQWDGPTIMSGIERCDAPVLWSLPMKDRSAFLVGPVGGFTQGERDMLMCAPNIQPVSLGDHILRAETASMICLCAAFFSS